MKIKLLIVDDDDIQRAILKNDLSRMGFDCVLAEDGLEALRILEKKKINVIVSDQQMPRMGGIELLRNVKSRFGDLPFIMLTGAGSIVNAVTSIQDGASDYIQKPYELHKLVGSINKSLHYYNLAEENRKLRGELIKKYGFENIIATSPAMLEPLELARKVAATMNTIVAIFGESGTGKEVLAKAIHSEGQGGENCFVAVNCAGIPGNLVESELFGYVKGAFTGADKDKEGKFQQARGGTLLLDEIGDFPLELQSKLLRALQERVYEKLGSNESVPVDFRIIVATNRDLRELVKQGAFREDLYHRIMTFPITLPPLRDRREDIRPLTEYFLNYYRGRFGKQLKGISEEAMNYIVAYSWPGNVRELKNCIERAAILADNEIIGVKNLNIAREKTALTGNGFKDSTQPNGNGNGKSTGNGNGNGAGMIHFDFTLPEKQAHLDNIIELVKYSILQYTGNNKKRAGEIVGRDRGFFYRAKK